MIKHDHNYGIKHDDEWSSTLSSFRFQPDLKFERLCGSLTDKQIAANIFPRTTSGESPGESKRLLDDLLTIFLLPEESA